MKGQYRLIGILGLAFAATLAAATDLQNGNSTAATQDSGEQAGSLTAWRIGGGNDQVYEQSYLFRIGREGAAAYVGTIGTPTIDNPTSDLVTYTFTMAGSFDVRIRYLLTGDTNHADIAEAIRIRNLGQDTLHFELFEYDDFDLNGTSSDDLLVRTNPSQMVQSEGGNSVIVGATAVPDHFEMSPYPDVLNHLFSSGLTTLDDVDDSPLTGDCTFAYQWNFDIPVGSEAFVSKDKILAVPEPTSMAVLGGLAALAAFRRRRK